MIRRRTVWLGGAAAGVLGARVSAATTWPDKPVKLVVGLAPGGISDQAARLISIGLAAELGQNVIVENRTGAGGAIAAKAVRDAAPDGYTLGVAFDGTFAAAVASNPGIGFDPVADFSLVTNLVNSPVLITTYPGFPESQKAVRDFGDLVRLARSEISGGGANRVLAYGTAGVGSTGHLAMELIKNRVGMFAIHIPYRGGGEARTQVLGKQIPLMLAAVAATANDVRTGLLKGLAVTSAKRSPALPDVPTLSELGLTGLAGTDINSWVGLVAPKRTPPEVVAKLNESLTRVMAQPQLRAQFLAIGAVPAVDGPAAFQKQIAGDVATWTSVIKAAGLRID